MKVVEFFVAKDGRFFEDEKDCIEHESSLENGEAPYLYKSLTEQSRMFNPKFNSDANCSCGHTYHRHFDGYEDNSDVGCKYCHCYTFKLAK